MDESLASGSAAAVGQMLGLLLDPIAWAVTFGVGLAIKGALAGNDVSRWLVALCGAASVAAALLIVQVGLRLAIGDPLRLGMILPVSLVFGCFGGLIAAGVLTFSRKKAAAETENKAA